MVKDRAYTRQEIHKILDSADLRMKVAILVMASSGVRVEGLVLLKLKDLEYIQEYDNIMRKHQQFAFTLGNPSSDILPNGDSKGYYQKFTKVMLYGIHNLALMKFMVEYLTNGMILVVKMEHLDIQLVMNMIPMEVVKATLKKVT